MTNSDRNELQAHIRQYIESGKLSDELFGDMALMYSGLLDPSLDGESFSHLKKYEGDEPGKGWPEIFASVGR